MWRGGSGGQLISGTSHHSSLTSIRATEASHSGAFEWPLERKKKKKEEKKTFFDGQAGPIEKGRMDEEHFSFAATRATAMTTRRRREGTVDRGAGQEGCSSLSEQLVDS